MKKSLSYICIPALLAMAPSAYSIEQMDQYYADNISEAVDQAREQPHHYDYSSAYRYKRTTAQSIDLNRIDLDELDDTRLGINTEQPDKDLAIKNASDSSNNNELAKKSLASQQDISPNSLPVEIFEASLSQGSYYKMESGEYRTTGIESVGTVIATPRN